MDSHNKLSPGALFKRLSLPIKMFVLTLCIGLATGFIMDRIYGRILTEFFTDQMLADLKGQAQEDRLSLDNYIRGYEHIAQLFISMDTFEKYVEKQSWMDKIEIKSYSNPPPWLPKSSVLRQFTQINFALLLDEGGVIREIYNSVGDELPKTLFKPTTLLLELSHNQSLMTMIDKKPFLITSSSILNNDETVKATLMLISPIDKTFLDNSRGDTSRTSILALLRGQPASVIASTSPDIVITGMPLDLLKRDFIITGKGFFDYGASDLYLQFATLLPIVNKNELIKNVERKEQLLNFSVTFVFITVFSILMLYITRRIQAIGLKLQDFSQKTLGVELKDIKEGDQLTMLENRFTQLTNELDSSYRLLEANKLELESKVAERTSELFELNMELKNEIADRISAEEKIAQNLQMQKTINAILAISLEPIPLKDQLERVLDLILEVHWLSIESKGGIFLVEETPNVLVLTVQKRLAEPLTTLCSRLPFGTCLCGIAAREKRIVFSNHLDHHHTIHFEGMQGHGHYCIPIVSDEKVLGVLNLYIAEGHEPGAEERGFLMNVASTLAGIIMRKRMEEQLEESTRKLMDSNDEFKTITYIFSHDIRSPLVNLKGFVSELKLAITDLTNIVQTCSEEIESDHKKKLSEVLNGDIPEALEFISLSTMRIDSLSNSILKLSRLGFSQLSFVTVDMDELVKRLIKSIRHQIEERRATITVNGQLPKITADITAMEQCVGNIIDNAVKYLAKDRAGEIEIWAEQSYKEDIFHFRDNGRGIESYDNEKVFAIFRRVGVQDVPGEGMGLSYVKTLIRRHNGRLWFESVPNVGSTFSFSIPKAEIDI